ncbi:putative MINDY deubiquitinase [Helianthus annuus]|uniref:ubiquitin carboxyl-terminal hydrolase MINDY-1 n=1 Tax=Helianthus annuus TaxID=4232 RepID=UPI000B8FF829|nr:ubiquitin carboxyl-terminal hydrolase MINDY-1 [Helianthus annuus]KAJ0477933.1 putative MINDY deubiquitinase [Helianthus annuus]KAJ0498763.1 putative MINDY deubiquitinase [Helianthus annuus]KAJ0664783.1 putative MINDY deubiquitinase [Helianthus annuus]KAJ0672223.1 putative MINDY deubiquitinase [Helianthus annuus]KAJ0859456.1 putative MINDY deubiquitinase [Helianthus annuus]
MAATSGMLLEWEQQQAVQETIYRTKTIEFFGRRTPIIIQSRNGPCPLLAVCNILSLRNELGLSTDDTLITEAQLLTLVADSLIASLNHHENVKAIPATIDVLPLLTKGLNVNVKFKKIDDIEFKRECPVFGILDIPVYHGWIIDPQDIETSNAIGSKSYDRLMEDLTDLQIRNMRTLSMNTRDPENHESDEVVKETDTSGGECSGSRIRRDGDWVTFGGTTSNEASSSAVNIVRGSAIEMTEIISGSSTSTSNENEDEVGITARQGELIKNFLENNASQLTVHGLYCLIDGIKDRELCVLFRNDHFSTMFKFEGALYTLVTDLGYIYENGVIWEKLSEVNGNTVFVDKNFRVYELEIEECTWDDEILKRKNDAYLDRVEYTERRGSSGTNLDDSYDPLLATRFRQLVLQGKHLREKQLLHDSPEHFPRGFIVGPEPAEYSAWQRKQSKKSSKKQIKKRLKEKCKVM